jgi:hypothetical protein
MVCANMVHRAWTDFWQTAVTVLLVLVATTLFTVVGLWLTRL